VGVSVGRKMAGAAYEASAPGCIRAWLACIAGVDGGTA
jgi:hypothetical protein